MCKSTSRALSCYATAALLCVASASRAQERSLGDDGLVGRLARIGRCESPSFSADGARIAFVADLNGSPQVWTVSSEGGWPQLVTALQEPVRAVSWSPKGGWLGILSGGRTYIARPSGTELQCISDELGEPASWSGWSVDGEELFFTTRGTPLRILAWRVESGGVRVVAEGMPAGNLRGVSADGLRLLLWRKPNVGEANLYLHDVSTQTELVLTPTDVPAEVHGGSFSPEADAVYFSDDRAERRSFSRVRLTGDGKPGPIEVLASRAGGDLANYTLSPDGRTALLAWNVDGRDELTFLDLASLALRSGPKLPSEMTWDLSWSPKGDRVALLLFGAAGPMDVWTIEVATGQLAQVTHAHHPGVDLEALVAPESVRFRSHDGLEIQGWLYRPPGSKGPVPYVLSFHGGPAGQERTSLVHRTHYQGLLSRGIGVFAPNVRGSAGQGRTFLHLDDGALRFDSIKDIKSCVSYLVENDIGDPDRLGIMGQSYGGYMAWQGLTRYPGAFAAGAVTSGIVDLEAWFETAAPSITEVFRQEFGDPEENARLLRQLSPVHRLDKVRAPTLVLHGALDTNCPHADADLAVEILERHGVPVQYVLFPDEGHGFRREENRVAATVALVDWFEKHLCRDGAPGAAP